MSGLMCRAGADQQWCRANLAPGLSGEEELGEQELRRAIQFPSPLAEKSRSAVADVRRCPQMSGFRRFD